MRITRNLLINLAKENAAKMAAKDRGLMCIYLTGSLLQDDAFIGGVTDIDLICVHDRPLSKPREIVRINADVHLDIAHYQQEDFEPARKLRTDAWIGTAFEQVPLVLYDGMRWYDFMRSSATAQFWRSENIAARARSFLVPARRGWTELQEGTLPQGVKRVQALLDAYRDCANGVAVLTGMPLTIRRMMLDLPDRAMKAGLTEFAGEFVQLFSSDAVNDENFKVWVDQYALMFDELKGLDADKVPAGVNVNRRNYFEKAVKDMVSDRPAAALWILVRTWTKAAAVLPKSGQAYKDWQSLCKAIQVDARSLSERLEALDVLLDSAEEAVDRVAG